MNILFFYDKGVLPEVGGIARITHNLVMLFRKNGNSVWIVSSKKLKDADYDKNQHFLPNLNIVTDENILYIEEIIKQNSIDLIINQCGMSPDISCRLLKEVSSRISVKYISCIHNSTMTPARNLAYQKEYYLRNRGLGFLLPAINSKVARKVYELLYIRKYKRQYRNLLDCNDKVVLLSDALKQEFLDVTALKESYKISVIPNINISEVFDGKVEKENIVLWIGNAEFTVKRLDAMILLWERIWDACPEWKLHVLGDGANLEDAKRIVSERNVGNIYFEGRINPSSFYNRAKYLVMTSSHEAFPMVLLEAFSNKVVPIVYNTFPTAPLLIKDNANGLLLKPYNLRTASKRIKSILNDKDYHYMSSNGSDVLDEYSENNIYRKWKSLFGEL